MSILEKWGKAIEARDEDAMNECLHDDYKFCLLYTSPSPRD